MPDIQRGAKPDWWDEHDAGTRDDAMVSDETERVYIRAENPDGELKRYWFDVKELTWKGKNKVVSDALKIREEQTELRIDQYYKDTLETMIQDTSVEGVTGEQGLTIFLAGMNPGLGDKLQEGVAPNPGKALSDQEEKNSDEPFAEGVANSSATGDESETPPTPTTSDEQ
jgi:hypothetical protein